MRTVKGTFVGQIEKEHFLTMVKVNPHPPAPSTFL